MFADAASRAPEDIRLEGAAADFTGTMFTNTWHMPGRVLWLRGYHHFCWRSNDSCCRTIQGRYVWPHLFTYVNDCNLSTTVSNIGWKVTRLSMKSGILPVLGHHRVTFCQFSVTVIQRQFDIVTFILIVTVIHRLSASIKKHQASTDLRLAQTEFSI